MCRSLSVCLLGLQTQAVHSTSKLTNQINTLSVYEALGGGDWYVGRAAKNVVFANVIFSTI